MAPSRKTISGLAPKQVSHALANVDQEHDLSLTKRSEKGPRNKTVRAKLANTTDKKKRYKKTSNGSNADDSQSEEGANEDSDESDDQDDDPEAFAPSGGKRIKDHRLRNGNVNTVSTANEADDRQAGLYSDSRAVHFMTPHKKKRTFSNVSILTNEDDPIKCQDYPRKKVARRLSDNNGRLVYDTVHAELKACMNDNEDAIMASEEEDDNEDDIYAILDDINESNDEDTSDEFEEQAMLAAVADSSDDQSIEDSQDGEDLSQSFGFGVENGDILPLNDEMYDELKSAVLFDHAGGEDRPVTEDEVDSTPNDCGRKKSNASARRVRFDDDVRMPSSSSSSSSSSDISEGFPDLLLSEHDPIIPQEQLDPFILQQIEDAHQDAERGDFEGSDSGSSYWDFGESLEASIEFPGQPGSASEDEGSGDSESLSGYDSDGDTTDDDVPTPTTISKPRTHLHRHSPQTRIIEPTHAKPSRNKRRTGPIMGTFAVDDTKPMAMFDHRTKTLRIDFPRKASNGFLNGASSTSTSPNASFQGMDILSEMPSLFSATPDVMMSGVFGSHPGQRLQQNGSWVWSSTDLFGGQIGLPETFFPSIDLDPSGNLLADTEAIYTTEEEDDDNDVDIHTFIDMTSYQSDNEEAPRLDAEETETTDAQDSTPKPNGRARSSSLRLLDHFDREAGTVSAFRNHHDRFRRASKLPHDVSLIATPLKTGKTAEDLMSPLRKRRSRNKARVA